LDSTTTFSLASFEGFVAERDEIVVFTPPLMVGGKARVVNRVATFPILRSRPAILRVVVGGMR
jgi:hypothetical protein